MPKNAYFMEKICKIAAVLGAHTRTPIFPWGLCPQTPTLFSMQRISIHLIPPDIC